MTTASPVWRTGQTTHGGWPKTCGSTSQARSVCSTRRFILIAKSFGGDLKPSVPCIGESHPMHVKEPTSLLAREQGEIPVKWSDSQTYRNG